MHETNILQQVDLNLLVTLRVLLEEENVTRAAERLGRSQPAVSHALAKLRHLFDDPLLVAGKGGMQRTPFATELSAPLERALHQLQSVLTFERSFDPATTKRTFYLGCPDALGVLISSILHWLEEEAPGARLEVESLARLSLERDLESGRHDIALGPLPPNPSSALRQLSIGPVRWKTLLRKQHPLLVDEASAQALSIERWLSFPHIVVRSGSRSKSAVSMVLQSRGLERSIGLTIPGFLLAAPAVAGTNMLANVPHIIAADAVERFEVVSMTPPVPIPEVRVAVMWHERWGEDPGHRWFREGLAKIIKERWQVV